MTVPSTKMKYLLLFILIFIMKKSIKLQDVKDVEAVSIPKEMNKTVSITKFDKGLSSQNLSDLHQIAKNISYSKGAFIKKNNETLPGEELFLRRSIIRKITISSDSDNIKELLHSLSSNHKDTVRILEQIEYLVHQYDVAVNFANFGGIGAINLLLLSPDNMVISAAASVLGAAMQSNPIVQKHAVKLNVGKNLLKQVSHKSPVVLPKIIFAVGSFLRNMPEAQEYFLLENGVSILTEVLKNYNVSTNTKLKIINIFSDLATEYQDEILLGDPENVLQLEKLFRTEIQKSDTCKLVSTFLSLEDLDTHQKIVAAMSSLCDICFEEFNTDSVYDRIKKLLKIYDPKMNVGSPIYPDIDIELSTNMYLELNMLLKKLHRIDMKEESKPKAFIQKNEL